MKVCAWYIKTFNRDGSKEDDCYRFRYWNAIKMNQDGLFCAVNWPKYSNYSGLHIILARFSKSISRCSWYDHCSTIITLCLQEILNVKLGSQQTSTADESHYVAVTIYMCLSIGHMLVPVKLEFRIFSILPSTYVRHMLTCRLQQLICTWLFSDLRASYKWKLVIHTSLYHNSAKLHSLTLKLHLASL